MWKHVYTLPVAEKIARGFRRNTLDKDEFSKVILQGQQSILEDEVNLRSVIIQPEELRHCETSAFYHAYRCVVNTYASCVRSAAYFACITWYTMAQ